MCLCRQRLLWQQQWCEGCRMCAPAGGGLADCSSGIRAVAHLQLGKEASERAAAAWRSGPGHALHAEPSLLLRLLEAACALQAVGWELACLPAEGEQQAAWRLRRVPGSAAKCAHCSAG